MLTLSSSNYTSNLFANTIPVNCVRKTLQVNDISPDEVPLLNQEITMERYWVGQNIEQPLY